MGGAAELRDASGAPEHPATAARGETQRTIMATESNESTTKRRSLYPPEHPRRRERYYFDDTLDAHPPFHVFRAEPTPEAMEAARQLAAQRGYPMPHFPPEPD